MVDLKISVKICIVIIIKYLHTFNLRIYNYCDSRIKPETYRVLPLNKWRKWDCKKSKIIQLLAPQLLQDSTVVYSTIVLFSAAAAATSSKITWMAIKKLLNTLYPAFQSILYVWIYFFLTLQCSFNGRRNKGTELKWFAQRCRACKEYKSGLNTGSLVSELML